MNIFLRCVAKMKLLEVRLREGWGGVGVATALKYGLCCELIETIHNKARILLLIQMNLMKMYI